MIKITWDIILLCNQKCPYCFQKQNATHARIPSFAMIKNILKNISEISECEITLMGGEPSLSPHLRHILSELDRMRNVKKIEVYTNGTNYIPLISSKQIITLSFHPHFTKPVFFNTLDRYIADKIETNLILMLEPDSFAILKDVYNRYAHKNINISSNNVIDFENKCVIDVPQLYGIKHDSPHFRYNGNCDVNIVDISIDGMIFVACQRIGNIRQTSLTTLLNKIKDTPRRCKLLRLY